MWKISYQLSRSLLVHAKSEVSQTQVMAMVIEEPWFSYVFMGFISFHGLHDVSSTAQALRAFHLLSSASCPQNLPPWPPRRPSVLLPLPWRPCPTRAPSGWSSTMRNPSRRQKRRLDWIKTPSWTCVLFVTLGIPWYRQFWHMKDLKEVVDVKDPSLIFISSDFFFAGMVTGCLRIAQAPWDRTSWQHRITSSP